MPITVGPRVRLRRPALFASSQTRRFRDAVRHRKTRSEYSQPALNIGRIGSGPKISACKTPSPFRDNVWSPTSRLPMLICSDLRSTKREGWRRSIRAFRSCCPSAVLRDDPYLWCEDGGVARLGYTRFLYLHNTCYRTLHMLLMPF